MGTREKKRRERERERERERKTVTLFGGSSPRWLNQSSTSGPSKHIQTVVWVAYKYQHHICTYTYPLWFTLIDFLIRAVNIPSLHVPFSPMHPNTSDWSIKTSGYTFCNLTVFNSLSPSFELSVDTTVFSDEVLPDASLPAKTIAITEKRMKGKKKEEYYINNCFFPQLTPLITMLSFAHYKYLLSFKQPVLHWCEPIEFSLLL